MPIENAATGAVGENPALARDHFYDIERMALRTEKLDERSSADASLMEQVLYEVKKVVVGQDHFLERVLVALLAKGHLLVEGVPGLAKTLTVNTLAEVIGG